jgi:hypothetical protein
VSTLRSPRVRVWFALALLVGCVVAWPITALTVFRDEPQGILGLSYLALILTALDILATTDVRKQDEE